MRTTWLLDLDNTLHNASAHVFPHIHRSMTAWLARHLDLSEEAANALRIQYWQRYGATLAGLVRHHGVDPRHFLHDTHQFERLHEMVVSERALRTMLRRLPGRKIVFSNGPHAYANAVVRALGIEREIDNVFAIEHMRYQPKPSIVGFRELLRRHRLQPQRCILVEDSTANLRTAKRLGMKTVLVGRGPGRPAYADLKISSVLALRKHAGWLLGAAG